MIQHAVDNSTRAGALAGTGITLFGAIDQNAVATWTGVLLSVLSAVVTFGLSQYREYREARRREDLADLKARAAQSADGPAIEARLVLHDRALRELADELDRLRAAAAPAPGVLVVAPPAN